MTGGKIFITGSTGTVGKELLHALNERCANVTTIEVKLLVRDQEKAKKLFDNFTNLDIEYVVGDLDNLAGLFSLYNNLFENVERIFFIAVASPTLADISKRLIEQTLTTSQSLKQVVQLSALGVSGDLDSNNYFRFHSEAEKSVAKVLRKKAPHVSCVVLRPNMFIQNFLRDDLNGIKTSGVFYRPTHDRVPYRISHVDVRDIAELAAQVLTEPTEKHAGNTYNITGPETVTYEEVAQTISKSVGKQVKLIELSEFDFGNVMRNSGLPPSLVFGIVKLYQVFKLNGTSANVHGDYQLVTGKKPRSLEDFFRENKDAFL